MSVTERSPRLAEFLTRVRFMEINKLAIGISRLFFLQLIANAFVIGYLGRADYAIRPLTVQMIG